MSDFYEALSSEPLLREHLVQIVGGTAAITKVFGRGLSVAYVSTGLFDVTWSANDGRPGSYVGIKGPAFHATTPAPVKAYTCIAGVYNATTRTLRVSIYDASNNLVDLAALQWLTLTVLFLESRIGS